MAQPGEVKPWKCKNGHLLGTVRQNDDNVGQLYLYRNAIDLEAATDEEIGGVDVIAVIEYAEVVLCGVCGILRTWLPGEASLAKILRIIRQNRGV